MNVFSLNKQTRSKGFSLVELLVVISVIGILTTVITANFSSSREKALDRALKSEFKEVQLALELYKSQHGRYPDADGYSGCTGNSSIINRGESSEPSCSNVEYIAGLVPEFIDSLPQAADTANQNCRILYYVDRANFSWYKLLGLECISASETIDQDDEMVVVPAYCDPANPLYRGPYVNNDPLYTNSISVFSPGGECY